MKDLRHLTGRAALLASASAVVCDLNWQGDFGKGISTGSGVWSDPGANPCLIYGPVSQTTSVDSFQPGYGSNAIPQVQFKLGMVINGDTGAEFVFGELVLAATTDLLPGQGYFLDENFNAKLLSATNANNILNAEVAFLNVFAPNTAAGTYYGWFQRAGHVSVKVDSAVATGSGETSATTAGSLKFPTSATAGQKSISPSSAYIAASGVTFTGTTVNGSPYITAVASAMGPGGITDLQLGQIITGTGLPANSCIQAIDKVGGQWRITIGTGTATNWNTVQNATANGTGVTFTVTSHCTANIYWPTLLKQN